MAGPRLYQGGVQVAVTFSTTIQGRVSSAYIVAGVRRVPRIGLLTVGPVIPLPYPYPRNTGG